MQMQLVFWKNNRCYKTLLVCSVLYALCSMPVYAQTGKVGINTTTPAAMFHVKDSSVLFTGDIALFGTPGAPPVSGSGIRMMWYPAKAAFRAGWVNGAYWNKDSIGDYSMGLGVNTVAKGTISVATGHFSRASGF